MGLKSPRLKNLQYFLFYFLLFSVITLAVFWNLARIRIGHEVELIRKAELIQIDSSIASLKKSLLSVMPDINTIYKAPIISSYLKDRNIVSKGLFEKRIKEFVLDTRRYDQVRFINNRGMEEVRVEYYDEDVFLVKQEDLQDKSKRYYFMVALGLLPGSIYMSPLDLNVEHNQIEKPFKPIIRFVKPVFIDESFSGTLVFNYLAGKLLKEFSQEMVTTKGKVGLLNKEGYFLYSSKTEDQWGFMLAHNKMFNSYYVDEWESFKNFQNGQLLTKDGLFTYNRFCIGGVVQSSSFTNQTNNGCDNYWIIYSIVEASLLNIVESEIYDEYLIPMVYLLAFFALISGYLARITTDRFSLFSRFKTHSAALEHSQDGVIIADPKSRVVYANKAFERISGYSLNELLGNSPAKWSSHKHDKQFYQTMWQHILEQGFWRGELINRRKNGELYNAHVSIGTVKNSGGKLSGYVAIQSDITQKMEMEKALKKEKSYMGAILETANEGIATLNTQGIIESANVGMEKIFETPVEKIIGTSIDLLIRSNDSVSGSAKAFSELLAEGVILEESCVLNALLEGGQVRPIDATANHFSLDGEQYTALMIRDVSERVRISQALEYKEAMLGSVLNNASEAIIACDEQGFIELFSQSAENMFGYSAAEMLIENIDILFVEKDQSVFNQISQELALQQNPLPRSREVMGKHQDGRELPLVVTIVPAVVGNQRLFTANIQDLTQVKSLLNSAHDAFVQLDGDSRVIEWNPSAERLFGWQRSEILNKPLAPLAIPERYRETWRSAVTQLTETGGTLAFSEVREWVTLTREGKEFPVNITVWPQPHGEGYHLNAFIQDITEKKLAEAKLRQSAYFDELTKLANRALFQKTLKQTLARCKRQGTKMGLLFLDLDKFKQINDTLGHDAGDLLLQTVAERISRCTRQEDLVARLGGDEFTVLIEGVKKPGYAATVAEKIISAMRTEIDLNGNKVFVTTSVGVATFPECGEDAESLMKAADIAMYRAKEDGRNKYHFYSEGMHVAVARRVKLENALRCAIEKNELCLNFQPQVNLVNGKVIGFEALLRWNNPELGYVSPTEFIPVAEEAGLIVSIGEWVLNTACQQLEKWNRQPLFAKLRMEVAVNLSAYQFKHDLIGVIERAVSYSGLEPSHLELEITESALMENVEECGEILEQISEMGIQISIDDFGTGYSSLQYLKALPIQTLKIDRAFIQDICEDADSITIVKAIIALAKSMGLEVIAEGVETYQQVEVLQELQCDMIQGYYYSKPLPVERVIPYLESIQEKAS